MSQTTPNQKTIKVCKEVCNRDNAYSTFNLQALQNAMSRLKGEAFKLWVYLNKHRDSHTTALSSVDALAWGIGSKSSYDRAVRKLIEKGYLVKVSGNLYRFYELPQNEQRNNNYQN